MTRANIIAKEQPLILVETWLMLLKSSKQEEVIYEND